MFESLAFLVPIMPWTAALAIALRQMVHPDPIPKQGTLSPPLLLSLWANLLALAILAALALQAVFMGAPGQVSRGNWLDSGSLHVPLSLTLDGLSLSMGLLVLIVSLLVLRFSGFYMHKEPGAPRYFMVINLFSGAMLLIILAGNAVLTFVGWELAGVSSYLLIGYVWERPIATINATRAFVTNRLGDAGFLFGIYLAYSTMGDVEWRWIMANAENSTGLGNGLMASGFLLAAMAKSAQVPFSPWISRALDGPTPSSAIFYGSLMVHAGVYLVLRMEPLLIQAPGVMVAMAIVGLLTALYGWLAGLVLSDVKSSMMFSTTSQVGLMFFCCGMGWFDLAAWHMGLHISWRIYPFLHAPSLMFQVNTPPRPLPWLPRWLFAAAQQRFWLEQLGDTLLTLPTNKLATDSLTFEARVVNPLLGLPNQVNAISSLAQWQDRKAGIRDLPDGGIGRGEGVLGKILQEVGSLLFRFEEQMVLKGGGEGLLSGIEHLGGFLMHIETLLSKPRYLLFMICITFVIIL